MTDKPPAMLELPEPELGYIETDKSRQPAFSARQMREALQSAQPAEVSDETIVKLAFEMCSACYSGMDHQFAGMSVVKFARAILALRPQAVSMTEQWRLLRSGERIEAGDEGLQDDCVTWLPLAGWEVGMTYNPTALVPMRRRVPSITAPAGGEVDRG